MQVQSLDGVDPQEKRMATTPVFSPVTFMDTGTWWATVHGVTKSQTQLSTHTPKGDKKTKASY